MKKESIQEVKNLINLTAKQGSHADFFKLLSSQEIHMDDFYDYSFKVQPGAQLSFEVDTISSIPPHAHRFYEVLFVTQGKHINYLLNSKRYQLEQGDILFIPPGHVHHPLLGESEAQPYRRYVLWLEADFFESICSRFSSVGYIFEQCIKKNDYLLRCTDSDYLELFETFETLRKEEEIQSYGWEAQIAMGAISIMNRLSRAYRNHNLIAVSPIRNTKLDTILEYIDNHLDEQLSLDVLSQQIFVSKSTLNHLFQKHLGTSIYQYVLHRRLLQAKLLILEGNTMGNICEKCGFSDYATFYRAFKKMYGMSPNEYKKSHLK